MDEVMSSAALQSRLTTRFVGRHLELHQEIDSTNARAVVLARAGAPDGALVLAEHQTAGRGRLGRRWFAPKGTCLLLSLVLRPRLQPRQAQRVTMICSLAAVEAIAGASGLAAQLKWPNDILIQGRKLGGLLAELGVTAGRLDYVVAGMGLNVNLDPSALPPLASPATSLSIALGHPVSRLDLLAELLQAVETRCDRLSAGWSPHEEWQRHLATLGQQVRVGTSSGVIEGVAEGVDEDGALLVRASDGSIQRVLVGDVTLRGQTPT